MTDWLLYENPDEIGVDAAIEILVSTFPDLKEGWDSYIAKQYKNYIKDRLDFVDIGEVSHYIADRIQSEKFDGFDDFFEKVEVVLGKGMNVPKISS
ncbi:MAG: hypothetical protein JWO06_3224 [Bacteroidota bacterium]|nr:hypothetical protein [Bacteroidota bacterium]